MAENEPGQFRVICAGKELDYLKILAEKAVRLGIGDSFLAELKAVEGRLSHEPLTWGDPLYPLRQLGLFMYRGLGSIFFVHYAVDSEKRLVYVKEFKIRPGHALEHD